MSRRPHACMYVRQAASFSFSSIVSYSPFFTFAAFSSGARHSHFNKEEVHLLRYRPPAGGKDRDRESVNGLVKREDSSLRVRSAPAISRLLSVLSCLVSPPLFGAASLLRTLWNSDARRWQGLSHPLHGQDAVNAHWCAKAMREEGQVSWKRVCVHALSPYIDFALYVSHVSPPRSIPCVSILLVASDAAS